MNRKWTYIIIIVTMLVTSVCTISIAQETNFNSNVYIPPTLQNLKSKQEFAKNFQEIKRIRNNIYSINMDVLTAKQNADKLRKEINFYMNEFKNVQRELNEIKNQNPDSQADIIFADQLNFTVFSYLLSLQEQLNLLELLVNDDKEGSVLFYSDYLTHIYYYVTLGDQMVAYVDNYYKLNQN